MKRRSSTRVINIREAQKRVLRNEKCFVYYNTVQRPIPSKPEEGEIISVIFGGTKKKGMKRT